MGAIVSSIRLTINDLFVKIGRYALGTIPLLYDRKNIMYG